MSEGDKVKNLTNKKVYIHKKWSATALLQLIATVEKFRYHIFRSFHFPREDNNPGIYVSWSYF